MHFIALALGLALVGLSAPVAYGQGPQPEAPVFGTRTKADVIPGHYIVAFKDSVDHPVKLARTQVKQQDGKLYVTYGSALKGYAAKLSKDAVRTLRKNPQVRYVVPDYKVQAQAQTVPTGVERVSATTNLTADIDGLDDKRVNANVAVIDSGVDAEHPDLNVVSRVDCTSETNGGLTGPLGMSTDAAGNLWVVDTGRWRIEKFNAAGEYVSQFGEFGKNPGQFWIPRDVDVDAEGHVWVVDAGNMNVQEFKSNGEFMRAWGSQGTKPGNLNNPKGIAVDAEGNIWVTDEGQLVGPSEERYSLQKFSPEGKLLAGVPTGTEAGQLGTAPTGIAVDSKGNIWVGDTPNNRVKEYSSKGAFLFEFGKSGSANGQLEGPRDIEFNSEGNLFVADEGNFRVQKFNPAGAYLTQFGKVGSGPGQFSQPWGLASGTEGSIFVSDPLNNRVEKWSSASTPAFVGEFGWPGCIESPSAGPDYPHGTHVAGTIGAIDNGEGVAGVAPGARIWDVRVLGEGGSGDLSWIAAGLDWVAATREDATTENDIEVANMSIGAFVPNAGAKPIDDAISGYEEGGKHVPGVVDLGVVVVVAAGNEGLPITEEGWEQTPAANADAITVGALTDTDGKAGGKGSDECEDTAASETRLWADDELAPFSNWGPEVDIVAPGVCILSTWPGGGYETDSGTSMASPHVAGAAALLAAESKPKSKADVEAIRNQLVKGGSLDFEYTKPQPAPLLYVGGAPLSETEVITGGDDELYALRAVIHGGVQPRGKKVEYQFEFGTDTKYGKSLPALAATVEASAAFTRVSQEVTGLLPDTTYHYRLHATSGGKAINGKDATFTTPAFARTMPATEVSDSKGQAALNGVADFSVLPAHAKTTYEFEYGTTDKYGSLAKATPVEGEIERPYIVVSKLQKTTVYHYRLVAKNEYGTFYGHDQRFRTAGWADQNLTKAFEETEGPDRVSCLTATRCLGVGSDYAYEWNGETWSTRTLPTADTFSRDLACVSATACMAVGEVTKSFGHPELFAMWWDGKSWSDVSPPMPSEAEFGQLYGVSCPAVNACFAVGQYSSDNFIGTRPEYVLLRWDGKSWSTLAVPVVKGVLTPNAFVTLLSDISCPSTSQCLAVGWAALRWDGSKWSQVGTPAGFGTGLRVSCSGVNDCVSTNYWETDAGTTFTDAAMHWNGTEWASMPPLGEIGPSNASAAWISGISCPEAGSCSAVGLTKYSIGGSQVAEPIAIRWDGSQWSNEYTDDESPSSGYEYTPKSVSCVSSSRCMAVGEGHSSGLGWWPLVLSYNYSAPTAITDPATAITTTSTRLHATVAPNSYETTYQFEYGESSEYGSKAPAAPAAIGTGGQNVEVSQTATLPSAGGSIQFRVVATNEKGTSYGVDLATPSATAKAATGVKARQATLQGSVNPEGFSTTYQFQYVENASYKPEAENPYASGAVAPAQPELVGSGESSKEVSQAIVGLRAETTYHYRLLATSAGGTTYGEDKTFTTTRAFEPPTYSSSFGSRGTGNGQLSSPYGITVDPSGNVWVTNLGSNRIEKFNSKGEYQCQIGSAGTGNGQFLAPYGVAADAAGNVWVADASNNRIQKISPECKYLTQVGKEGTENGQFGFPEAVAVDPSGNIWVADTENARIQKFNSSGVYLTQCGGFGTGNGQFTGPTSIAADAEGNIWVGDDAAKGRIEQFSSTCEYIGKFDKSTSGAPTEIAPHVLAIDPAGNLWTSSLGHEVSGFFPEGEYITKFGETGTGPGQFSTVEGIGIGSDGTIWAIDHGSTTDRVEKWVPGAPYPVETGAAKTIKATEAKLTGKVNPEGVSTSYQFEYGTTTSLGSVIPASPKSVGSGSSPVAVSETPTSLKAGQIYYYRLVATGAKGTTYGEKRHFTARAIESKTAPTISQATPFQGVPETTTNGTWTGEATSYAYRWRRCNAEGKECADIAGATASTYTPTEADVGKTLVSQVTATAATGTTASSSSAASGKVLAIGTKTEYSLPAGSDPWGIASGPDGNLWFTDLATNKIGKITTSGTKTEYALPALSEPLGIIAGPDGNLWFTEYGTNKIGKITPSGTKTEYSLPANSHPFEIAAGPDGNLWFTNAGTAKVGKITTSGTITEYALESGSVPEGIAVGPDGNLWLVDYNKDKVRKVTTSGTVTSYSLPAGSHPTDIAPGPDGNLWFTDQGTSKIGKITTSGTITEYAAGSEVRHIAPGPDGNLWFTSFAQKFGKITTAGTVTTFTLSEAGAPEAIVAGPDHRMWFSLLATDKIAAVVP